jgi:peptidoglycan/xylan/chitin deacetylase (PgdA/CDA1 family)
MYHHVSPQTGMITVSPANFESQLSWLKENGYRSLTTRQFADHLDGQVAPAKSVLITFDDGYLDNWVYAAPLLRKYGYTAVVFLVTSWVGQGPVRPQMDVHNGVALSSNLNCLPATPEHRQCEESIRNGRADDVIMRWSEVLAAQESGVLEFHSHTHTHTRWDLTEERGQKNRQIAWELQESRKALIRHLGAVSEHFCWPQGYFDADYVAAAHAAGFRYLYTTQAFGQNRPGSNPAGIYRFAVRNTHGASIGRRIRVATNPIAAPLFNGFKRWKRRLREA